MHLDPVILTQVRDILQQHVPAVPAYAFGSRIHGRTLKQFSDLDLCLHSSAPLPSEIMMALVTAFDESDIPIKVDVIDWNAISPEFRTAIQNDLTALSGQTQPKNSLKRGTACDE